tara:strand:+ start:138 stop:251 length:114 start_codon:yes stop_codon:yes gene_type:complete
MVYASIGYGNDIKVKSIGAQKLKGGQSIEIFKCLDVI